MLDFKKLAEVTSIEDLPEGINVLVNDGGVVKQVPANKVGEMVPDALKKAAESGDGFGYTDGNELHQIDSKYIKKEDLVPEEVAYAIENDGIGYMYEGEIPAINITWDGDTEDRDSIDDTFYKVSNNILTTKELIGSMLSYNNSEYSSFEITAETIEGSDGECFIIICDPNSGDEVVYEVLGDIEYSDVTIHKGIYFLAEDGLFVSSITKEASIEEMPHKIDKIYMPDSVIQVKEDEDGNQYIDPQGILMKSGNKSTAISPDDIYLKRGVHWFSIGTDRLYCSEGEMGDREFILDHSGLRCDEHAAFGPMFNINTTSGIEYKDTWNRDTNIHYQLSWEELLDPYLTITINSSGTTANKTPSQITALMQKVSVGCRIKGAKTLNLGTSVADENGNPCWVRFDKTTKEFTVLVEVVDDEWVFHLD